VSLAATKAATDPLHGSRDLGVDAERFLIVPKLKVKKGLARACREKWFHVPQVGIGYHRLQQVGGLGSAEGY
jgi:hypothetical protein